MQQFHPIFSSGYSVQVILPLATPKPYTYYLPEELLETVQFGVRVEVQFGKSKYYTGVVIEINNQIPEGYDLKPIISVLDEEPVVTPTQVELWKWIAEYYCCTPGEVMNAAMPANLKLTSESILSLHPETGDDFTHLDDRSYLIAEALTIQQEITVDDVRKILNQKSVYRVIKRLLDEKVIVVREELKMRYKPKEVVCVRLTEAYAAGPGQMNAAFERTKRSDKQTTALMAYLKLSKEQSFVRRQDIYRVAEVNAAIVKALEKKGIFELYNREVSRIGSYEEETVSTADLSKQQTRALAEIQQLFQTQSTVLLHGVTGSGKTRVYVELMKQVLEQGGQVLYLLPEIALTTQIVNRLQRVFGDKILVYHSRLTNNERVEVWESVRKGKSIVLGARSALFLPFKKLSLLIVDEEHDQSFKQYDPSPRYQCRDTAMVLAKLHQAKVLLGTATPSIESYFNAQKEKYGLVEMPERFGGIALPEIQVVDAKAEMKKGQLKAHFTPQLLEALELAIERGEQAILFQNRRGYAPTYHCLTCEWHSTCIHCDVSLTYHQLHQNLKCHYCGYQTKLPKQCPACGSKELILKGFGTEKIEEEIKIYLPKAKVARMDWDTVRSKQAYARLLNDFEERRLDILVGTQMITKGLDFENVGVVGILSADQLLSFPDFRASERAFQLMVQVSGRAGRKHKQGKVIIQAFNPGHPVLKDVIQNDFIELYRRELQERQSFKYPPYYRLIAITLKHKNPKQVNAGAKLFTHFIREQLGDRVMGPAVPYVSRIRSYYLLDVLIKLERDKQLLDYAKSLIKDGINFVSSQSGLSGLRINVDVDPM